MDFYNKGGSENTYKTYIDRGTSDDKSDIHFTSVQVDGKRTYISYPIMMVMIIGIVIIMMALALAMFM